MRKNFAEINVFPSSGASIGPRVNNGNTVMDVQIPIISAEGVNIAVGDIKTHLNTEDTLILNDITAVDEIIRDYSGSIHFMVINGDPERDKERHFKIWHNARKGMGYKKVDSSRMKVSFTVTDAQVIRPTYDLIRRGLKDGWLKTTSRRTCQTVMVKSVLGNIL